MSNAKLQPHEQRVVYEKIELEGKIEKLRAFRNGELFKTLPDAEQLRLNRQYSHMFSYRQVLIERIEAFPCNTGAAK